jgi:hypothetical protein
MVPKKKIIVIREGINALSEIRDFTRDQVVRKRRKKKE